MSFAIDATNEDTKEYSSPIIRDTNFLLKFPQGSIILNKKSSCSLKMDLTIKHDP